MKKFFAMTLAAALLLAAPLSSQATAEVKDLAQLTCGEFVELEAEEMAMMYFWLDGYVSAKTDNTVMDSDAVADDLTALIEVCAAKKEATVLNAIGH